MALELTTDSEGDLLALADSRGQVFQYRPRIVKPAAWQRWACELTHVGKDEVYLVVESPRGEWSCSCPAWFFQRHVPAGGCKHIQAARQYQNHVTKLIERLREMGMEVVCG